MIMIMVMAQLSENEINHVPQRESLTTLGQSGGAPAGSLEVETCAGPQTFPRQGDEDRAKRRQHHTHGCAMGRIVEPEPAVRCAVPD